MSWEWFSSNWSGILGDLGIIAGLFFSGFGLWRDVRTRRAQTLLEFTKLHRELWSRYDERPELRQLFERERDLGSSPLSTEEIRFSNFLFLHLRAAYSAKKGGIYEWPERVQDDWREILSHPGPAAAWDKMKRLHDRDFVEFVDGLR